MVIIIGHRGAGGYLNENTAESIKRALEMNVDAIEMDVRICKTGEPILMHDETLDRISNERGLISEKTLNEIKKITTLNGEKIITLKEGLNIINRKVNVVIELKEKDSVFPVAKIIQDYIDAKGWKEDDFAIISFRKKALLELRKLNSKIRLALLLRLPIIPMRFAKKVNLFAVGLHHRALRKRFIKKAHENNILVFVWAGDKEERLEKIKTTTDVDGIISFYPDKIHSPKTFKNTP
ncbi:MAG: glycerophosphodiester phosphodiesterase [Candidatus Pacearchaeota archaeon]|jgi:glycerophosphoryl diester phosphodiesterase